MKINKTLTPDENIMALVKNSNPKLKEDLVVGDAVHLDGVGPKTCNSAITLTPSVDGVYKTSEPVTVKYTRRNIEEYVDVVSPIEVPLDTLDVEGHVVQQAMFFPAFAHFFESLIDEDAKNVLITPTTATSKLIVGDATVNYTLQEEPVAEEGDGNGGGDVDGSGGDGGAGVVDNSHITPDTLLSISTLGKIDVSTGTGGKIDYSLDGGRTWVNLAKYSSFIDPGVGGESEILFRANEGATGLIFTGTQPLNIANFLGVNEWWGSSCKISIPINSNSFYVPPHSPRFITNLSGLFGGASEFDSDITGWDMSHVTNMDNMLSNCRNFNQDISNWDVSNVTSMMSALSMATFNQDISNWDVSKVTNMEGLFRSAAAFNQDISKWDVSSVTKMNNMFRGAKSFNQDLSSWCVGRIGTKPSGFDSYDFGIMPQWTLPKPVWGTCPIRV